MNWKSIQKLSLLVCLGSGACASYNPYVTPDPALYPTVRENTLTANEISYAQAQVDLWRQKANSVSNSQLYLNSVILPTALTAANFAVTGDRGESAITTLSTVALGGLTLRELSRSNPRQAIYMSGIKALECLAWNAAPLALDASTINRLNQNVVDLEIEMTPLTTSVADLETAIAAIKAESAGWSAAGKVKLASIELVVQTAKTELSDAKLTLDGANALSGALTKAPGQLRARIGSIQYEVDNQLRQQEASPEQILGIAAGFSTALQSYVSSITPTAETGDGQISNTNSRRDDGAKATPGEIAALGELQSKLTLMKASLAKLQTSKAKLKSIAASNALAVTATDSFADCEVEGVVKPITIIPPDLIREVSADEHGVTITGGSGYFDVSKVGRKAEGFDIKYEPNTTRKKTDATFVVSDGFSGDQIVAIRDTSNLDVAPVYVTFRAKPAEQETKPGDPGGNGQGDQGGANGVNQIITPGGIVNTNVRIGRTVPCKAKPSKAEARIMQSAILGARVEPFTPGFIDGIWGNKSKAAAKKYLALYNIEVVDPALLSCRIIGLVERDPGFRRDFFNDASKIKSDRMKCEVWNNIELCWMNARQ